MTTEHDWGRVNNLPPQETSMNWKAAGIALTIGAVTMVASLLLGHWLFPVQRPKELSTLVYSQEAPIETDTYTMEFDPVSRRWQITSSNNCVGVKPDGTLEHSAMPCGPHMNLPAGTWVHMGKDKLCAVPPDDKDTQWVCWTHTNAGDFWSFALEPIPAYCPEVAGCTVYPGKTHTK